MGRAAADDRSRGKSYSNTKRGNAARREVQSASIAALRAARLQCQAFLLGFQRGDSLLRKRIPPLIRAALHALLSPSRPTGATQSLQTSLETESPKIRRASSSILLRCKDCKGINHVNSTAFPRRFQTPTIFPSRRILGRTIPASVNTPRRASSGRNGFDRFSYPSISGSKPARNRQRDSLQMLLQKNSRRMERFS